VALGIVVACVLAGCGRMGYDTIDPDEPADAATPDASTTPDSADAGLPACDGALMARDPETGHCFVLLTTTLSQPDGQAACAADYPGAHLAIVTTASESATIASIPSGEIIWGWIDLQRTATAWAWSDGARFVYTNWQSGEPSNQGGSEDCVIVHFDFGGTWDDRTCADVDKLHALCERE